MEKMEKNTGTLKKWEQDRLQFYELIKTIQKDDKLRERWIKRRSRAILNKNPELDEAKTIQTITDFFESIELLHKVTKKTGKPTIHISPRKIGGLSYTEILGVKSENLAGCITRLVDSAADDMIRGYKKGVVLGSVFGNAFSDNFNKYIKKRINEEVLKKCGNNLTQ